MTSAAVAAAGRIAGIKWLRRLHGLAHPEREGVTQPRAARAGQPRHRSSVPPAGNLHGMHRRDGATCSCTVAGTYYTSTTWVEPVEANAVWFVDFSVGLVDLENEHVVNSLKVRAVRGGL